VPLGIAIAIKMIPPAVLADCRAQAREVTDQGRPRNRAAAGVIVAIWLLLAGIAVFIGIKALS
jgi:hypothetical protein